MKTAELLARIIPAAQSGAGGAAGAQEIGFMLLALGIILLIGALFQYLQNRTFSKAARTSATVTHKSHRYASKKGTIYEFTLEYSVEGVCYQRYLHVSAGEYNGTGVGDKFEILYLPDRPKKIMRPGDANPRNVRVIAAVGAVAAAAGSVLFALGYYGVI